MGDDPEGKRPLDALNAARHDTVIVDLKNGKRFTGQLEAFDIHINTVLHNAVEREGGEVKRKIGKLFIRGDTILTITPE